MNSQDKKDKKSVMAVVVKIIDYIIPVAISAGLVVWLFHKVNFKDMMGVIREGCDFRYVVLMMAITTLSHMVRGIRWGIQLRAAGVPRMSVNAESVSIFGAYSLNLVFPRLGEAWRCLYVSRRENVSLSTVVGTDMGDRGSDMIVVLSLFILSLIVAHPAMMKFISHYSVGKDIRHIVDDPMLWIGISAVVGIMWYVCHYKRKYKFVKEIDGSLDKMWGGFKVLFTMRGRGMYVVLTLLIWTCYYMETYVMFYAFSFTRELISEPGMAAGFIPGLVVFVFGSFSMAIPSNGGLGPWNLAVMFALSLYGIPNEQGTAFSMVMWSAQAAWLVVLGIYSAGYVMLTKTSVRNKASGSVS
ncbi:MAG: flippase-like domain-containing protein [Candidatus Amulumruptor caecigallinarius]|nr:flippase-like domain-containing protein [Candidatus Amulumruptor caecigallinarius]